MDLPFNSSSAKPRKLKYSRHVPASCFCKALTFKAQTTSHRFVDPGPKLDFGVSVSNPVVADVSLEDEDDPFESIDENWGAPALNSASFESAPSTISRGRRRSTRARTKRR